MNYAWGPSEVEKPKPIKERAARAAADLAAILVAFEHTLTLSGETRDTFRRAIEVLEVVASKTRGPR